MLQQNEVCSILISVGYLDSSVSILAETMNWTPGVGECSFQTRCLIPIREVILSPESMFESAFNSARQQCLEAFKTAHAAARRQEMFKFMNEKPIQEP